MGRTVAFIYGVVSYSIFFGSFVYMIGFLTGLVVPKTIDSGPIGPLGTAILVNALMIVLFGIQHTVMARPSFKTWWTKIVPEPVERSTYVLLSSLLLILLYWQWRPMNGVVWSVETEPLRIVLTGMCLGGFLLVLYATFLIDHFDLFGLRQVFIHLRGAEPTQASFKMPTLYRLVRHPLYLGWLAAFWFTPDMTHGRLLFAVVSSVYIFVAIPFEEKDLAHVLGEEYQRYRQKTPMIIPFLKF